MTSYTPALESLAVAVDSELHRFLAERRAAVPDAAPLIHEIERVLDAGGKRLRPAFCYWGYRAAGGTHDRPIVDAAASLELLHTFAIVHDDMMDRSETRRSEPASHAKHGADFALLAGDLALVLADDLFLGSGWPPPQLAGAFDRYSSMRQEVIAGQYLDLELSTEPVVTEERARWVAVLKSGRYSIEQPLAIGACLGGADRDLLERIRAFGAPLGEAFQLRDDLLGAFGDEAQTGKPVGDDLREGKPTPLLAIASERARGDELTLLSLVGSAELSSDDITAVQAVLVSTGAVAETEATIDRLTRAAIAAIEVAPITAEASAALVELAEYVAWRDR